MTNKDGTPCKRCGNSDWYTGGGCKKCTRARNKTRRAKETKRIYNLTYKQTQRYRDQQRRYNKTLRVRLRRSAYARSERQRDNLKAQMSAARTRGKGGGSFTAREWRELCAYYDRQCLCCQRKDVVLTADHVVSIKNGGTSNIDNIQPLCRPCNSSKGAKNTDYRHKNAVDHWIQLGIFNTKSQ